MKRRKVSCNSVGDCWASDLSLHGRCVLRSWQDSSKVPISRLLAHNCCSLGVVVSVSFASRWWPCGEVVISRSLPLWDLEVELGHSKVEVLWLLQFHVLLRCAPIKDRDWTSLVFRSEIWVSQGVGVDAVRLNPCLREAGFCSASRSSVAFASAFSYFYTVLGFRCQRFFFRPPWLVKNSRVLDAKSPLKSANLG